MICSHKEAETQCTIVTPPRSVNESGPRRFAAGYAKTLTRTVPMMQIRIMRMRVVQRRMAVPMRIRLRNRHLMLMPVMAVVPMTVLVFQRLMLMLMVVPFGEVHP
jgi:hypothetical protein